MNQYDRNTPLYVALICTIGWMLFGTVMLFIMEEQRKLVGPEYVLIGPEGDSLGCSIVVPRKDLKIAEDLALGTLMKLCLEARAEQ